MLFLDTKPSWRSVALLVLLAPIMYLICLGVPELRLSDEALTAAFSQDMVGGGGFLKTHLYGHPVPGFPLYAWAASLCSFFRMPDSFSVRLPAVLALFLLAILSGLFARRIQSPFAGIITSAVVLTSVVSFRVGGRAQSEILNALLLSAAWYFLYVQGWGHNRWWLAWSCALLLVFISVLAVGAKAVLIFYVPLFFLWKEHNSLELLQSPAHVACATALVALLSGWMLLVPGQPFMPWNALAFVRPPETLSSYLSHLVTMFPKALLYLFPWTLISWAPFCLAMRQFELMPGACRFLRAIVLVNAVMFWLMPGGSPLHLLPALGPMAVLTGVHAEIVLRRYRDFWGKLLRFSAWSAFLASILSLAFWVCVLADVFTIKDISYGLPVPVFCAGCSLIVLLLLSTQILFNGGRRSFRTCLLWTIFAFSLLHTCNWTLPSAWASSDRKHNGLVLAGNLPPAPFPFIPLHTVIRKNGVDTLYLALPDQKLRSQVLVETFYLRVRIRQIKDPLTELPPKAPVVFMLSPYIPAVPGRDWTAVSPAVKLDTRHRPKVLIQGINAPWSGKLPIVNIGLTPYQLAGNTGISELRIYRGTLKKDARSGNKEL